MTFEEMEALICAKHPDIYGEARLWHRYREGDGRVDGSCTWYVTHNEIIRAHRLGSDGWHIIPGFPRDKILTLGSKVIFAAFAPESFVRHLEDGADEVCRSVLFIKPNPYPIGEPTGIQPWIVTAEASEAAPFSSVEKAVAAAFDYVNGIHHMRRFRNYWPIGWPL